MIVYALYSIYFDGCDSWENIIDLYRDPEDAYTEYQKLHNANENDSQSYDVRGMAVK